MRKVKKKRAMIRALKALSDYIRERDNWICFTCGVNYSSDEKRGYKIDAGHFFSRQYKRLLFNEQNVHAQCVSCNKYKSGAWDEYYEHFIAKYGKDLFDKFRIDKNKLRKWSVEELLHVEKYFQNKLKDLLCK